MYNKSECLVTEMNKIVFPLGLVILVLIQQIQHLPSRYLHNQKDDALLPNGNY